MNTFNTATINQHLNMIKDAVNDGSIDNIDELHREVFNTDYFIIGYHEAEKWIIENFDSVFSAIEIVRDYELENFGESNTSINDESIANMLSYICGEYVISEYQLSDCDNGCELLDAVNEALEG